MDIKEVDSNYIDEQTVILVTKALMDVVKDNSVPEALRSEVLKATIVSLSELRKSVDTHYAAMEDLD